MLAPRCTFYSEARAVGVLPASSLVRGFRATGWVKAAIGIPVACMLIFHSHPFPACFSYSVESTLLSISQCFSSLIPYSHVLFTSFPVKRFPSPPQRKSRHKLRARRYSVLPGNDWSHEESSLPPHRCPMYRNSGTAIPKSGPRIPGIRSPVPDPPCRPEAPLAAIRRRIPVDAGFMVFRKVRQEEMRHRFGGIEVYRLARMMVGKR